MLRYIPEHKAYTITSLQLNKTIIMKRPLCRTLFLKKMTLESPLYELKGIGQKTAQVLIKQNIKTVGDLILSFPSAYHSVTNLTKIDNADTNSFFFFKLTVKSKPFFLSRTKTKHIFTITAEDSTGSIRITYFNQPYYASYLNQGNTFIFYGKPRKYKNQIVLDNPKVYSLDMENTVLPIYAISGIKQKVLRSAISHALKELIIEEKFSKDFLTSHSLLSLSDELKLLHKPEKEYDYISAGKSYLFKEFLIDISLKSLNENKSAPALPHCSNLISEFQSFFEFKFTNAQISAMTDIYNDMGNSTAMNRLLQGDVGCGKTAVAFFAAYYANKCGFQSVIMASTELLALQHYKNSLKIFGGKVGLLTASTSISDRNELLLSLKNGTISLLITTHAVLFEKPEFFNLALVIADEQHRFGVKQRAMLCNLSNGVHSLVMSATPIPRTMALSIFGNVSVSIINELPPGRIPIKTYVVPSSKRLSMYKWIHNKVIQGKQVYVVCPYIDNFDEMDTRSVNEVYNELHGLFPDIQISILTGKMKSSEKDIVMNNFRIGKIDILISTTVIEVGVDVKNAVIMVIEGAERFGLATLHQLRGRVGRGSEEGYCYLLSDSGSKNKRLELMTKTTDGFRIAEFDLKTRGGGQLYGVKQHGSLESEALSIIENPELYLKASEAYATMQINYPKDFDTITKLANQRHKKTYLISDN